MAQLPVSFKLTAQSPNCPNFEKCQKKKKRNKMKDNFDSHITLVQMELASMQLQCVPLTDFILSWGIMSLSAECKAWEASSWAAKCAWLCSLRLLDSGHSHTGHLVTLLKLFSKDTNYRSILGTIEHFIKITHFKGLTGAYLKIYNQKKQKKNKQTNNQNEKA